MKIAYVYNANDLSVTAAKAAHTADDRLDWMLTNAKFRAEVSDEVETRLKDLFIERGSLPPAIEAIVLNDDSDNEYNFGVGVTVLYEPEDFFAEKPVSLEEARQTTAAAIDEVEAHPERWAAWKAKPRFACFYCRQPIPHGAAHFATDGAVKQWYPDRAEMAQIHLHDECRAPFAHRVLAGVSGAQEKK